MALKTNKLAAATAVAAKRLLLVGNRELKSKLPAWLGSSPLAKIQRLAS